MKLIATTTCFLSGEIKCRKIKHSILKNLQKHLPTNIKESPTNLIKLSNYCDKPFSVICFIGKYYELIWLYARYRVLLSSKIKCHKIKPKITAKLYV